MSNGFVNNKEYVFGFDGVIQTPSSIAVLGDVILAEFTFGIADDSSLDLVGISDFSSDIFTDQQGLELM